MRAIKTLPGLGVLFQVLFACGLLAAATSALAAPPDAAARKAADAMVSLFAESWNQENGEAYGRNYWPEAELVDPSGAIWEGRQAIVKLHEDLWAGVFQGTHMTASVRKVTMLCPDVMIVDFNADLTGFKQPPPGSNAQLGQIAPARLKHVMERRNGMWKVISAQTTVVTQSAHPVEASRREG